MRGHEAWAVIRRSTRAGDRDTVGLVGGKRRVVTSLLDVPLEAGTPDAGHIADRLLAVPFRQVAERGFEAHDDGTPLVVVDVTSHGRGYRRLRQPSYQGIRTDLTPDDVRADDPAHDPAEDPAVDVAGDLP